MVKNLKINKNKLSNLKKFKVSKLGLGLVTITTAISLFLTGCGFDSGYDNNWKKNDYYYVPPSVIDGIYDDYDAMNDPLISTDSTDYSNSEMIVTSETYNNFINYINGINTIYNYESYYNIDAAYSKYNEVINNRAQSHSHELESLTVEALVKSVKSNNKEFLKIKKAEYTAEFYEEFSDSELRKYCSIIMDIVQNYNNKGLIKDINEVKCILGDLKIFSRPTMTNAYITDDNCLMISPSMIETLKIKVIGSNQDVEKSTIGHEAVHLIQKSCKDNVYSIGNSYKFEDLAVNPLFYNWFYEGSAEKLMTNMYNYSPLVYEYYINYINSLGLSTILNNNNYVNQPEETTLSPSLDPLFNMFGCKTENEKKEIIKLMYSLDIIETDTQDFIDAIDQNMNETELVNIKRNLKGSVCETLTKYFYKNLASLVKEKNIPLNDVFYYITVFEADVDSHIVYGNKEKYDASINFIENYIDIQKNFFNFLSSSNKYTQEEIENMFDGYGLKKEDGSANFDLSYLNSDKKLFFSTMLNKLYNSSTEQIIDVYTRNSDVNVKK